MNSLINKMLSDIERQHNVKILFACETGSRAWGFPSPDSDYDVRVVYKHELDWYLSLSDKKDTIEFMSEDGELDMTGWDVRKCFQLMWRSNGALLERVQSPIIYRNEGNAMEVLKEAAFNCYSPIATMHHYLGMARNTFADIEGKEEVKLKKLFYGLRATLACRWILDMDTPPPIVFTHMLDELQIASSNKDRIRELIRLKAGKDESYIHAAEPELNAMMMEEITRAGAAFNGLPGRKSKDVDLDGLFRKIVKAS